MTKILHLKSSPQGEESHSIRLGEAIVEKLKLDYPNSVVHGVNLHDYELPHLQALQIQAFYTPAEFRMPELQAAIRKSDQAIADLLDADLLVIGAPMYNFGIPSVLKAWIDHVVRVGVTFAFTENGPVGLVASKPVFIAEACGSIYSTGPLQAFDFVKPYLRAVLGFIGLTDVTVLRIEGTAIPGVKETALTHALASIDG